MFRVFSLALSGANIVLNVGALITDEVLRAKLNDLEKEINKINTQLANIGIDMKSGIEFFKPIAEKLSLINFSAAEVDVLTKKDIAPRMVDIKAEANQMISDIAKIPDATLPEPANTNFWANVLIWTMRGATIVSITASGAQFVQNLKTYYKDKQRTKTVTEESSLTSGLNPENPSRLEDSEERIIIEEHLETRSVETDSVPKTPKAAAEGPTLGEKIGVGFDGVMFVLTAVSLVMNVLNYISTEEALHKQIDELTKKVADAKTAAAALSNNEVKFFTDTPSFFLYMEDQINIVAQIATLAQTVKTKDDIDNSIALLLKKVGDFKPFTDDDYKFMKEKVAEMDAVQTKYAKDQDAQGKALNEVFKTLAERLPNSKFVDAFTGMATTYDNLKLILTASVNNFNFFYSGIKAINLLKNLVKANTELSVLGIVMNSELQRMPTEADLLVLIALYTNLDTYKGRDLKTIRAQNKTLDTQQYRDFITAQLTGLYGTLEGGKAIPDSARTTLISSEETYKLEIAADGDVTLSKSAKGSPDYAQVWHSDVHGTTPGALYSLLLTEKGDLQLNEMNASVNGAIPTVKKTWWSTGTADKGVAPYKLVLYEYGLFLQDSKKTNLWSTA